MHSCFIYFVSLLPATMCQLKGKCFVGGVVLGFFLYRVRCDETVEWGLHACCDQTIELLRSSAYNCRFSMTVANCKESERICCATWVLSEFPAAWQGARAGTSPPSILVLAKPDHTFLDYDLVQIVIHIGSGFPHTDLYTGLDLPDPILYVCILYNSIVLWRST